MKIRWLGHACFVITSDTATKIITDPYKPSAEVAYGEIKESADIVTVSHDHLDHNNVSVIGGNPEVVRGTKRVKGIEFKGIATYHDTAEGRMRGKNTMFCFEIDGIRVEHLGDLGHLLNDKQVAELGRIDILLIPVGGFYTIDANVAGQVCNQLKPKVIIPMHFKTDKSKKMPIAPVDGFLQGKKGIKKLDSSEVEFKQGQLPETTQIIVLKPAL